MQQKEYFQKREKQKNEAGLEDIKEDSKQGVNCCIFV